MTAPNGIRFELLGPLRARDGERKLDLGPSRQRAVLAALLLSANQPLSAERIVDAVWRDDPPQNGPNVVQKYVSGLRQVLEPHRSPRAPGQLIALTDAGYVLRVAPGATDVDTFHLMVRQGRIAELDGRLADAAACLRAAAALWRGDALAGIPGPVFDAARDQLTEDRTAALETRIAVELELGHHDQLVPELVRAVADQPVRERLRYLLMLALHRGGRQAEALAAFDDARRYLVDTFGVEPGEQLRELHVRILRADPPDSPDPSPAGDEGGARSPWASPTESSAAAPIIVSGPAAPPEALPAAAAAAFPTGGVEGRRKWLERVVAIGIPLVTFGVATWAVMIYYAVLRRSPTLYLAAAVYFAMLATCCFAFGLSSTPSDVLKTIGLLAWATGWVGGVVHGALLSLDWGRATRP